MSALGQKRTLQQPVEVVCFVPKADITSMSKSAQGVLGDVPVFHHQVEIPARSPTRLRFSSGLPSTNRRSAKAPYSTTPSLPGYGLRKPDRASNSAFVDVAMISASADAYTAAAGLGTCQAPPSARADWLWALTGGAAMSINITRGNSPFTRCFQTQNACSKGVSSTPSSLGARHMLERQLCKFLASLCLQATGST